MKMKLIWDPPKADPTLHTCRYSVRRRTFQVRSTAGLVSEWHRFLFRSESDHGCGKSKKEEHSETERLFVGEVFGQNGFNIGYSGRAQDPHLIGEAGEKAANFVGRKLVQVRGNNAPCSLHHKLHQKRPDRDDPDLRYQYPEGNQACS